MITEALVHAGAFYRVRVSCSHYVNECCGQYLECDQATYGIMFKWNETVELLQEMIDAEDLSSNE